MALGFYFDMSACIGCKACQMACKDTNDLPVGVLLRKVESYEVGSFPTPGVFHLSSSCNHCADPACAKICPTGATYIAEDGTVVHDRELCIGCGACANACPYSHPMLNPNTGKMSRCDSCYAIRQAGGEPQCVASCPMRALEFGDIAELMKKHPDAVPFTEVPMTPASETVPGTIVTLRACASNDAVVKRF